MSESARMYAEVCAVVFGSLFGMFTAAIAGVAVIGALTGHPVL